MQAAAVFILPLTVGMLSYMRLRNLR